MWLFLPVDHVIGYKNLPGFYSVMSLKHMNTLAAAGIKTVTISQEEAPSKVSIVSRVFIANIIMYCNFR